MGSAARTLPSSRGTAGAPRPLGFAIAQPSLRGIAQELLPGWDMDMDLQATVLESGL